MRTARVVTNRRCNQNCTYCNARRATDEPARIEQAAVQRAIAGAAATGAAELVLTGGEPTLRGDLAELIAAARAAGVDAVVVETNATTLDADRVRDLAESGLTHARVNLTLGDARLDAVTRDPGGFERTLRGLVALLDSPVQVDLSATIVRSTADLLPSLPDALAARLGERLGRIRALTFAVPTESPDPSELMPLSAAARVIAATERAARRLGLAARLSPDAPLPPCYFEPRVRPSSLFSLTAGGEPRADHVKTTACAGCAVRDGCSGVPRAALDRFGELPPHPVEGERARRKLSLISTVEEQIARELVTPNLHKEGDGSNQYEEVIRTNFRCNQSCRFCFVSTHLPSATDDAIEAAIRSAGARGAKITLSGGEPALSPRLLEYVALSREHSQLPIQLQTNAVLFDDAERARAVVDAGVAELFISLHGSNAATSDAVTGAPGTFERTVRGIDNFSATHAKVILNFVICGTNAHDLPAFVELVGERWPGAFVNISFVAPSTDVVPRDREMIPRYTDVMPHLVRALDRGHALGLDIGGFESMCGIPLCLVPDDATRYFGFDELPPDFDRGEFVHPEPCSRCDLNKKCYGLRRGYAELHGVQELRARRRSGSERSEAPAG